MAPYVWSRLGEALDPGLREPCVEVLLAFVDRRTCWTAIGETVACFPLETRGLALRALRRIADTTSKEQRETTLLLTTPGEHHPLGWVHDPTQEPWDQEDEASVHAFQEELRRYLPEDKLRVDHTIADRSSRLTDRAAVRALALLRAVPDPDTRADLLAMLAGSRAVWNTTWLSSFVGEALEAIAARETPPSSLGHFHDHLLEVCLPGDRTWEQPLARVIDRLSYQRADLETFFTTVGAFGNAIARAGGAPAIDAVRECLAKGLPLPPWA